MSVEKLSDEMWVGVKFQSNAEIAGSPRNSFRAPEVVSIGGRALIGLGAVKVTEPCQTPNGYTVEPWSQTTSDKIRGQKGNSPDHQLRSPMSY